MDPTENNPMDHPAEQPVGSRDESPKFGRLLAVLLAAVLSLGLLTFLMEAMYT